MAGRSVLIPNGQGVIRQCPNCDTTVVETNLEGRVMRISTRSIPLSDAVVLARYLQWVINVWRPLANVVIPPGPKNPVVFSTAVWWRNAEPPSRGSLHVRHTCGLKA